MSRIPFFLSITIAVALGFARPAHAQSCPLVDVSWEAYVDPVFGNDTTGVVAAPATLTAGVTPPQTSAELSPFKTINAAIGAVRNTLGPTQEGIVRAQPGVYFAGTSAGTNIEHFPIVMQDRVHLQGVGAKECVIRGRPGVLSSRSVFLPFKTGATRSSQLVLVDYSHLLEADEPMLDGFTFQGGDVQVYSETETPVNGRISNCVFDMREGGFEQLSGPLFGVLIVSIYNPQISNNDPDPLDPSTKHYPANHFKVFNNTFIQGFRADLAGTGAPMELARAQSVAVCDVNDPTGQDPLQLLRGVCRHSVQNNIMRSLDGFPRTATLGLDTGDTEVSVANNLPPGSSRPTNAFDAGLVGDVSVDPSSTFVSWVTPIGHSLPVPWVDLAPADPGFIGEFLCSSRGAVIRDFRLLPDSVLVDQGASPQFNGGCVGILTATNGLAHSENLGWVLSSFDFDGEVNGNPRIIGADVDIGFDETDLLAIAGSYGNDTHSHGVPWTAAAGFEFPGVPAIQTGNFVRSYIMPAGSAGNPLFHLLTMSGIPLTSPPPPAWRAMPGSVAIPLFGVGSISGPFWLDFAFSPASAGSAAATLIGFTNPESGQVHSFGELQLTVNDTTLVPSYLNTQLLMFDATIGGFAFSNLQSEYL